MGWSIYLWYRFDCIVSSIYTWRAPIDASSLSWWSCSSTFSFSFSFSRKCVSIRPRPCRSACAMIYAEAQSWPLASFGNSINEIHRWKNTCEAIIMASLTWLIKGIRKEYTFICVFFMSLVSLFLYGKFGDEVLFTFFFFFYAVKLEVKLQSFLKRKRIKTNCSLLNLKWVWLK